MKCHAGFLLNCYSNLRNAQSSATKSSSVAISASISATTAIKVYFTDNATKNAVKFCSVPMFVNLIVESAHLVKSNVRLLVPTESARIFVDRNVKCASSLVLRVAFTPNVQRNALSCVIELLAIFIVLYNLNVATHA